MSESNNNKSRREFMAGTGAVTGLAALAAIFGGGKNVIAQEIPGLNAMGATPEQARIYGSMKT